MSSLLEINGLVTSFDTDSGWVRAVDGISFSVEKGEWGAEKVNDRDHMFVNRDREFSTIVGDSGGYQIGKGVIKFDWMIFKC